MHLAYFTLIVTFSDGNIHTNARTSNKSIQFRHHIIQNTNTISSPLKSNTCIVTTHRSHQTGSTALLPSLCETWYYHVDDSTHVPLVYH